jgi:UDP-glucose 4-epimerase
MPKMLVTGGVGFIGSHAVDLFLGRGSCPTLSLEEGLELTVIYFREKEQIV